MELIDYMNIGMGLLLIVIGWLCYRFPNMINPYGGMSEERKALVDINGLKRATAIIMSVAGGLLIVDAVLSACKVIDALTSVHVMTGVVLVMLVPLIWAMKKYNGFGRDKSGEGVYGPRLEKPAKWTLVILGLSMVFVAVIVARSSRPQQITVGEESVTISGMYGREIPVADIVSVELLEQLPPIKMRTNGSSTGKYSKGHFLLENDEKCMLFVRHRMPPYIEIRTVDNLYYLNGASEEETLELFGKLKETMNAKLSAASRHCEERSNPEKEHTPWIASSCLLAMTARVQGFVPRPAVPCLASKTITL